jgi:GntR family transcriptional regulator
MQTKRSFHAAAHSTSRQESVPTVRSPFTVDKESPLPLYAQLTATVRRQIVSGEWPVSFRVPSERTLCELFGVSRVTVRQALEQLVREGSIVRTSGRGTFVASLPPREGVSVRLKTTQRDVFQHGEVPGAWRFEPAPMAAPPNVQAALKLKEGAHVAQLSRQRDPGVIETVYLVQELCPNLQQQYRDDQALYKTLSQTYGIVPGHAVLRWRAVACPSTSAQLLRIASGQPVLRIEQTTFSLDGRAFEHLESTFRDVECSRVFFKGGCEDA